MPLMARLESDGVHRRWASGVLAALWGASACGGDASSPGVPSGGAEGTPAASAAPTSGEGTTLPNVSGPSAPGAGGPPVPPRELREIDSGSFRMTPVSGICPEGTRPVVPEYCQLLEKRGGGPRSPCVCEYECSPACGLGEVCAPDGAATGNACECHPAMELSAEGCGWPGLVDDATFDDDAGWKLWTSGASGAASAIVGGGRLELALSARCSYAWAGTAARLPPRSLFPEGAALVFDYAASSDVSDPSLQLSLGGGFTGTLSPTERVTERHCIQLDEQPALSLLELALEANGFCAEPLDIRLSLDNLRLEPDPSCG